MAAAGVLSTCTAGPGRVSADGPSGAVTGEENIGFVDVLA